MGKQDVGIPRDQDVGDPVVNKPDNIIRITGGNIDNFTVQAFNNRKANDLKLFLRGAQSDIHLGQEHGVDFRVMPRDGTLADWLRTENKLRTVVSQNRHTEPGTRRLHGGTFACAFGEAASRVSTTGVDPSGLGRWSWMLFRGRHGVTTRIITAYQPNRSRRDRLETVYAQHDSYWFRRRRTGCPIDHFRTDLGTHLLAWKEKGEKLIVFIDGNENVRRGKLRDMFTQPALGMREVTIERHPNLPETPSFYAESRSGSYQIDGVWATTDVQIVRSTWLNIHAAPGDHRNFVIDLHWESLIGETPLTIARPDARRLVMQIQRVWRRYNARLKDSLLRHRVRDKLYAIYNVAGPQLTAAEQEAVDKIDRIKTEAMIHAEKKSRKLRMGEVDFSPKVNEARRTMELWRMVMQRRQGKERNSAWIKRRAYSLRIVCPLSITLTQATQLFRESRRNYRKLKPRAPALRQQWLTDKVTSPHSTRQEVKEAKRQIRAEEQRDTARQIKRAMGKAQAGSIARVEVEVTHPGCNTIIETYESQEAVEAAIIENNTTRFRLTENTPPMQEPLVSELGFEGTTEAAEQILAGTYVCPPGTDQYTRLFLEALQAPDPGTGIPISTLISADAYVHYWRHAKERTSSSFSGLHFGHWKAAAFDAYLAEVQSVATELAYASGHSYLRWQRGLSVMLEKKKGVIFVNLLRAILLMEADFNFANKLIFGNRMMEWATAQQQLPDEAWGGIKDCSAAEAGTFRVLNNDISRQRRLPMAVASVDAETCYDRMAHSIASICCQRWRVPKEPIQAMLRTIQQMRFHIRTRFGDSERSYGGDVSLVPFQGACQGNGGAPAIWLAVSTVLIELLRRQGCGTMLASAIEETVLYYIGVVFVDDTDLIEMADSPETPAQTVIDSLQRSTSLWHGALRASGGALAPIKCSWSLADYYFNTTGACKYCSTARRPANIQVPDLEGNLINITRLEPSEATKALGFHQALDGNMKAQTKDIKQRADKWATSIHAKYLSRVRVYKALTHSIWPSLQYPLCCTTIVKKKAEACVGRMYKTLLPMMGVCRNVSRKVRHASTGLLGLGAPHVYYEQGVHSLKMLLLHAAIPSMLGKMYRANIEQAQLAVGTAAPLFSLDYATHHFLISDSLVKAIWHFTSETGIEVHSTSAHAKLQRMNDRSLMDLVRSYRVLTDAELLGFNRVRCRNMVYSVADISTGDGRSIESKAFSGIPPTTLSSRYHFPRERPTDANLRAWKKGLSLFTVTGRRWLAPELHLGPWITEPHRTTTTWWFDSSSRSLYETIRNLYRIYRPRNDREIRHGTNFYACDVSSHLPANVHRATAFKHGNGLVEFGGAAAISLTVEPTYQTLRSVIQSLDSNWPLEHASFPDDGIVLANAIRKGTAQGVSDGSYFAQLAPHLASASWIAEDSEMVVDQRASHGSCKGVVRTSGTTRETNAQRGEYQGIHTILLFLKALCIFHDITEGLIRLGCDNTNSVRDAITTNLRVPASRAHVDMVRAIRRLIHDLPITVIFEHVEGHQDDFALVEDLPRMAQLNVLVDTWAKQFLRTMIERDSTLLGGLPPCPSDLHGEGWTIAVDGVKATGDPAAMIRFAATAPDMQFYLNKREFLSNDLFYHIDWDAIHSAMSFLPQQFQLWAVKNASGWCAVGQKMLLWKKWDDDHCPCCDEPDETSRHVVLCPDERMRIAWIEPLRGFQIWLEESDTHPDIIACIIAAIEDRDPDTHFTDFAEPEILEAAIDQDNIGWHNFLEGRISNQWRIIQQQHMISISSRTAIHTWTGNFIANIFKLTHSAWIARRDILHARAPNGLPKARAEALLTRIRAEYALGPNTLLNVDQHRLTDRTLEQLLHCSANTQQNWLDDIAEARKHYEQQRQSDAVSQQQSLLRWLNPSTATNTDQSTRSNGNQAQAQAHGTVGPPTTSHE